MFYLDISLLNVITEQSGPKPGNLAVIRFEIFSCKGVFKSYYQIPTIQPDVILKQFHGTLM